MENQGILITSKDKITPSHKSEHEKYEYFKYEVTERKIGELTYAAFYDIPPLKANYPYHYHTDSDEIFYVIKGSGILKTPDGDREIKAGDIIVCPAGEKSAHKIINTSETEYLTYLDVDAKRPADVVFYPDSGKVGIIINGKRSMFFKADTNVGYYEGE